jgi:hypothetical protein
MPSATDEKRKLMERNFRVLFMLGDNDPEMKKLIEKVLPLQHEFRDGRLYVGSEYPPKHEVRRSKTGNVYCKCPAFAFRERPGRGSGQCKHSLYAQACDIEIPTTEDKK